MCKRYIESKEHAPDHFKNCAIHSFRLTIRLRRTSFRCLPFDARLPTEDIHQYSIVLTAAICAQNAHATVKLGFKPCNKVSKLGRRSILVCRYKNFNVIGLVVNKRNQLFVPMLVLWSDERLEVAADNSYDPVNRECCPGSCCV